MGMRHSYTGERHSKRNTVRQRNVQKGAKMDFLPTISCFSSLLPIFDPHRARKKNFQIPQTLPQLDS